MGLLLYRRVALAALVLLVSPAPPSHAADFDTRAAHAIIVDVATGSTLFEKAADEPFQPASLAKLMTVELVFQALAKDELRPDQALTISREAWTGGGARSGGSSMFARLGSAVPVDDLLRGVIVQSGNDAAIALSEGLAGNVGTFVDRMNARAADLGMAGSHFANPTGYFDPEQRVTARDLSRLAIHLITTYPDRYPLFGEPAFTWNKITQKNRNPLLSAEIGADGLKTGYLPEAGYSLVASAVQDGNRLVAILAGYASTRERAVDATRLLQWAFRSFEHRQLYSAGESVTRAPVYGGVDPDVPLVAARDLRVVVEKGGPGTAVEVEYRSPLIAPISRGDTVGRMVVRQGDEVVAEAPVQVGQDVPLDSFPGRAMDAAADLAETAGRRLARELSRALQ